MYAMNVITINYAKRIISNMLLIWSNGILNHFFLCQNIREGVICLQ